MHALRSNSPTVLHIVADGVKEEGSSAWNVDVPVTSPDPLPVLTFRQVATATAATAAGGGGAAGQGGTSATSVGDVHLSAAQLTWLLLVAGPSVDCLVLSTSVGGDDSAARAAKSALVAFGEHVQRFAGIGCVICWPVDPTHQVPFTNLVETLLSAIPQTSLSTRASFSQALPAAARSSVDLLFGSLPELCRPVVLGEAIALSPVPTFSSGKGEIPSSALFCSDGEPLGRGTFGEVRVAFWNDSPVAVKLIRSEGTVLAERERQALLRDIRGLMRVDHRNVVRVHGYCTSPLALVMEHCPAGALDTWLAENRIPRAEENAAGRHHQMQTRCDLFAQVAAAMKYLHSQNIAHCDLKANNVLVKFVGQRGPGGDIINYPVAVVTDLGLAKLGSTPVQRAAGGAGAGSPSAPSLSFLEACRYDVMCWAIMVANSGFGALGEWETPMPPDVDDPGKWWRRQWQGNSNRPSLREESLPHGLAALLRNCWNVEPAGRPSFREVLESMGPICSAFMAPGEE